MESEENGDPLHGYHIGLMFQKKTPGSTWESFVSKMIDGPFVHVDMCFVPSKAPKAPPRLETMKQLFSTFVGEHFSGYVPKGWTNRSNLTHTLLLIPVSSETWDRARNYVSMLCSKKTPYNYSDLALCPLSNSAVNLLAKDVDAFPTPRTVFCSQAAVLTLRHALSSSTTNSLIKDAIWSVNSRGCSPMGLYTILQGIYGGVLRVDVDDYVHDGVLRPWTFAVGTSNTQPPRESFSIMEESDEKKRDEKEEEEDDGDEWVSSAQLTENKKKQREKMEKEMGSIVLSNMD